MHQNMRPSPSVLIPLLFGFGLLLLTMPTYAGPPFITDDPDPVPYHHWELYTFASGDRTMSTNSVEAPAIEINNGVAPNTQLHLIVPEAHYSQPGMSATGVGDTEFGVKYRFVTETPSRPEVGIFPMAEVPTGDQSNELGNGKTWYRLPIWLQKSFDRVTVDGGGGVALNSQVGQQNSSFSGLLVQYETNKTLTLGAEAFQQGAQTRSTSGTPTASFELPGARWSSLWNVGGYYNVTSDFSLLFSAGHSYQGQGNAVFYISIYRTWGPGAP
jgi:hypothetical protein